MIITLSSVVEEPSILVICGYVDKESEYIRVLRSTDDGILTPFVRKFGYGYEFKERVGSPF